MSGLVKVDRELKFARAPLRMGKDSIVNGRFNLAYVTFVDDFLGDTLNADYWASSVGNGGNAPAVSVAANGTAIMAANGADNDCSEWYGEANWYAAQECVIEVRYKVNAITAMSYAVGFANAASNTDNKIAFMIGGSNAITIGTNVTDAACVVFDTDADTDKIFCISTIGGAAAQSVITALAPEANTYEVVSIHLDATGNAAFYRNGACIGYIALAVTATTALRPYLAIKDDNNTARLLTVDYVKCWEKRAESSSVVW